MKVIRNAGTERVIDLVRPWLEPGHQLDMVTPALSLFAFAEWHTELAPAGDTPKEGELILYQTPAGTVRVEVLYESETFWLNRRRSPSYSGSKFPQSATI